MYKSAIFICCFGIVLYLIPHVGNLLYNRKAKKFGAEPIKKVDIKFPLGIPSLLALSKAASRNQFTEYIRSIHDSADRLTIRSYFVSQFIVSTVDPENIKAILSTQFKDFELGNRKDGVGSFLGKGIFTLDGEEWYHARALLRPQFTREQISRPDRFDHKVDKLIDILKSNYKSPKSADGLIDIQELFYRFTLDSATEFLFGESVDSLDENPRYGALQFADSFNKCQAYLSNITLGTLLNRKKYREWVKICHGFVDNYVKKALDSDGHFDNDDRYVFIYALAQQTKDPIVIRDQAINILLAGRDTTSAALSFSIYCLARYPHYFQKLRQTVLEDFGTNATDIKFESLKRSSYLQYFIKEVLRLYPIVPSNSRNAARDTTLPRGGGADGMSPILVEKGSIISYSVCSMHRSKQFYGDDADEFRPERWEGRLSSWDYLPFNGGPRICLGQQYALTEISYVLVRLLQSFKEIVTTPERISGEPVQKVTFTASVNNGVHVNFVPT